MDVYWDPDKVNDGVFSLEDDNKVYTALASGTGQSAIGAVSCNGKLYFEIECLDVGNYSGLGVCNENHTANDRLGQSGETSWRYLSNGSMYHNSSVFYSGSDSFGTGDVIQFALDNDTGELWVGKNGSWYEGNSEWADPVLQDDGLKGTIFPGASLRYAGNSVQLRTLASEFSYAIPGGFNPWGAIYSISGSVQEEGSGVQRTVRAYKRSDGGLSAEATSAADGSYSMNIPGEEHYIVFLDDTTDGTDYNAIIYDRVTPINN